MRMIWYVCPSEYIGPFVIFFLINGIQIIFSQVDSAYDGDEESAESTTAASSPEKCISVDPYGLDHMEDVPMVCKSKAKNKAKKSTQKKASSTLSQVPTSTSTPVLGTSGLVKHRSFKGKEATPEVTPILPVHSPSTKLSGSDGSFITPYNRRSSRKRPHPGDSDTPLMPTTQLNYSSQGDSGIVVSPSPKRQSLSTGKELNSKVTKTKKRQQLSILNKAKNNENEDLLFVTDTSDRKRKVLSTVPQIDNIECGPYQSVAPKTDKVDHCFGFTISPVPTTPPSSRKNRSKGSKPRQMFSTINNKDYRVSKELILSDSAGDSMLKGENSNGSDSSDNLIPGRPSSPPLFSDDIFSIDAGMIFLFV